MGLITLGLRDEYNVEKRITRRNWEGGSMKTFRRKRNMRLLNESQPREARIKGRLRVAELNEKIYDLHKL